jgi:NADH:ubiquinone oxidoreductase subunit 3 (subunit A)
MIKNAIIAALILLVISFGITNFNLQGKLAIANKAMSVTKLPEYEVAVDLPEEYMEITHTNEYYADKLIGWIDRDTLFIRFSKQ